MTAEHRLARAVQTLQAEVHSSPASSRLNLRPCRFKWTRPLRRTTKSGFCACAITFQTQFKVAGEGGEVDRPPSVARLRMGGAIRLLHLYVPWRVYRWNVTSTLSPSPLSRFDFHFVLTFLTAASPGHRRIKT
jgi:hypothetical protein